MHVSTAGIGPGILFIHGSAADADVWQLQRRMLAGHFRVITYDRRGTPRSPLPAGASSYSVAQHAADAAALLEEHGQPALVCGSSFGAVCALELARQRPGLVRGLILCEPPLPPHDHGPSVPESFLAELQRLCRVEGGTAAAEYFLRTVLGSAFDRMAGPVRARCLLLHEQIELDCAALGAYRVDYASLARLALPVLLLGGERSQPYFRPTLDALAAALPHAELRILAGASHMMHADAAREFHDAVLAFAERVRAGEADHAAAPGA